MPTTLTPNKTVGTPLFGIASVATATVSVGAAVDVSTKLKGAIAVKTGRTATTALTNELLFRLEGSASAADDAEWFPVIPPWFSTLGKTAAVAPTLNGATSAGAGSFVVSSITGIAGGDYLYLKEATLANSEWCRVASISGTTVTLENNLTRAHTNGITITDTNEPFVFPCDLSQWKRIRLVVDAASNASGTTVDVIAWLNTLDSISGT